VTDVIRLTIAGDPIPMGRPRVTRNGMHTYTPSRTTAWRDAVRLAWKQAGAIRLPDAPLALEAQFLFARPPSHFLQGGKLSAAGRRAIPGGTADVSNLVKNLEDSLSRFAFTDDRFIVLQTGEKRWAREPATHALIWVIQDDDVARP
jgi:Holliday junction resolvase RusA-like endonuclease